MTASDQAPLQAFPRRLVQQNERVPDIFRVGLWMSRQNQLHPPGQAQSPAPGFGVFAGMPASLHLGNINFVLTLAPGHNRSGLSDPPCPVAA